MRALPPIRLVLVPIALLATLLLAGCAAADPEATPSFNPTGACTADGSAPGAYPDLEALLPKDWQDQPPDSTQSGRTCTQAALGTLAGHGITELRFAGSTWKTGGVTGFTMAVFEAPGLDTSRVIEFYDAGVTAANAGTGTTSETTVGGAPAQRLDVALADGSKQTVVAWPAGRDGRVFALLTSNVGDNRLRDLLDAFGSR